MAYIPPHKRRLKIGDDSPSPALLPTAPLKWLIPRFQRNRNFKSIGYQNGMKRAKNALFKWFVAGLSDVTRVSDCTRLEFFERKPSEKLLPMVLNENDAEEASEFSAYPWVFMADTLKYDLVSSFEQVKGLMKRNGVKENKPSLILRFGKVLFKGNLESLEGRPLSVNTLKPLRRYFSSNIPASYMEFVTSDVILGHCFKIVEENSEMYRVKLSDNTRPGFCIMCICASGKVTNQLELCRIESSPVRHLVADMSCLGKIVDLRLILSTKKFRAPLTDEEVESARGLIELAVLDPESKGGLRWPMGQEQTFDSDVALKRLKEMLELTRKHFLR